MDEGDDYSDLPVAKAPPTHPTIDPNVPGQVDGRTILEVDLDSLTDKAWRRPGADLSDWFNYGFDEVSWEAYCYRRRDVGEAAHVLKTNVINFAGLGEDQIVALPPEVRGMVMTGATAIMNAPQNPAAMMGAAPVGMNPMMHDMSGMQMPMGVGMQPMAGVGPMAPGMQGMGGEMQPQGGPMPPNMHSNVEGVMDAAQGSVAGVTGGMQEGYNTGGMIGAPHPGIGQEFPTQETPMGMYSGVDANPGGAAAMGRSPVHHGGGNFRGGGGARPSPNPTVGLRGRGSYMGRGRGRGGYSGEGGISTAPIRPASPLPPGVPTGPRNSKPQYKDRDGNAPAVDGLDYGGHNQNYSGDLDDRSISSSRKRRASPGDEHAGRGVKRR
ncbi:Fip1-domain-containing protein [Sistotremastrum suecicum HHB10207 ss-3]|uniref:Fip1-domain-containing protein n=1 Tax=Sistotremastrum suecicum HHB10207 ss-3 TaxID=1314776 RepID=A0A166IM83_9AGAM|nr:Fip1-domain-containing protein [Sistotremastrum suecicum HHB10207 ss-3]